MQRAKTEKLNGISLMMKERVNEVADKAKSDKLDTAELKSSPVRNESSVVKDTQKKKPGFFRRISAGIKRWFKELKSEAKKVTWPTFKQVVNNTLVVIAVVAIVGSLIVLADLVFRDGLELFIELFY